MVALFPAGAAEAVAAVAVEGERTVLASTVVAARPRCRRRRHRRWRFLAVVAIADVVGRLHVMVATWKPAVWLNTKRAFKPFARQRSYNAEKSALETAGCDVGRAGTPCLRTLHLWPRQPTWARLGRCGGKGELENAGPQPARLVHLRPRRGRWGGGRGEVTAKLLSHCAPHPQWERGEQVAGQAPGCRRRAPSQTKVSSVLHSICISGFHPIRSQLGTIIYIRLKITSIKTIQNFHSGVLPRGCGYLPSPLATVDQSGVLQ